jgi:hypothetical protein
VVLATYVFGGTEELYAIHHVEKRNKKNNIMAGMFEGIPAMTFIENPLSLRCCMLLKRIYSYSI